MGGCRRQQVMVPRRDINKTIDDSAARIEVEIHHLVPLGLQPFGELNKVAFLIEDSRPVIENLSIFECELCCMDGDAPGFQGAQGVFDEFESVCHAPEMLECASRPAKVKLTIEIVREYIHIDRPKIDLRQKLLIRANIAASESLD